VEVAVCGAQQSAVESYGCHLIHLFHFLVGILFLFFLIVLMILKGNLVIKCFVLNCVVFCEPVSRKDWVLTHSHRIQLTQAVCLQEQ
jgi:hypothetical protein